MPTTIELGYNPTLKELAKELREQKEWLIETVWMHRREYSVQKDLTDIENGIEKSYDELERLISNLVAFEFREIIFRGENINYKDRKDEDY